MKKKLVLGIVSALSLAVVSFAGYYGYHIYRFTKQIQVKPTASTRVATQTWTGGRVNILLIGGDARPGEKADNSDSMILLSIDPKTKHAQMFSIMRDTWWKIPSHQYSKINASNLIGGPELAVQTVENFLDIPINYYVETDFTGFQKMVDILGGVDINVDENMQYYDPTDGTNINLKQGEQHLDGTQALNYVRFRHDAMGDFNRTKRQREFLKALAVKTESTTGILKLPQLLDALAPYVQTNMSADDMLKIGTLMHGIDLSNVQTAQVPPMDDLLQQYLPEGGDVLIPNVLATREYVHQALGMDDKVTASAEEQSYWNMYKNGDVGQTKTVQADFSVGIHQSYTMNTATTTDVSQVPKSESITTGGRSTTSTNQNENSTSSGAKSGEEVTTFKETGSSSNSSTASTNPQPSNKSGSSASSGTNSGVGSISTSSSPKPTNGITGKSTSSISNTGTSNTGNQEK